MKDKLALPVLLLVFLALAAGIVTAGCLYYGRQQDKYRTEVEHKLAAVANLKVGELSAWRGERLADASVFFRNTAFSALVRRWIERPQELTLEEELRSWISRVQTSYRYDRVALLDATGNERMSVPDAREPISSVVRRQVPEVLRSGQVTFVDFYRHEHSQKVCLGLLVPILDARDGGRPIGVVSLTVDSDAYLYPFIQRWPTPSETAETLLVRREGNEVVFLNEIKFQKNTALALRIPLERRDNPAVKAALGEEGNVEGIDYRGVPVLAALRAVPDSPWFLVARMDAAEVYAPMRERLWLTVLFVGVSLICAAAGVGLVWRDQIARFNRQRAEAAEILREVNENLNITLKSIGDAVIATDAAGKIARMNPIAEKLTGWSLAEAIGRPLPEVFRIIHAQTRQPLVDPVAKVLDSGHTVGMANDTALLARNGTERQIADSASPIRNAAGQTQGVVLIFRDVTHEYAAAERLRLLDRAINAAGEGICITGPNEAGNPLVYANHGFERLTGYSAEEVLGQNMRFLQGADTDRAAVDQMRAAIESNQESTTDLLNYRKDGTPFWNRISITPVKDAAGRVSHLVAVLHDITVRKRAREELQELLREKESLLKEVHHRVKNNLQVISSLVRLQSAQVKDGAAHAALRDVQNRILSMASLHETLYRSGSFARVDLAAYLQAICSQVYRSLVVAPESVQLRLDVASVGLDVSQAVPCGLIVNELVSNCLEHAFPDGRAGEVRVELHPVDGGPALRLRVADNGVGLPADLDLRQLRSLGLQLVSDLVGQLQGQLAIGRGPGAVFEVIFTPQTPQPVGDAS